MIISASRRTDIPAFYLEWFLNRLREGYALVRNPVNLRQVSKINLTADAVECVVFWTKNPAPLLDRLDQLDGYPFYVQFTLNPYDYDLEGELPQSLPADFGQTGRRTLPGKEELLNTFRRLADKIGPERMVWRYSPAIFNARYTEEFHLEQFSKFAATLRGYTSQCKLSFLDLYPKIRKSMADCGVFGSTPSAPLDKPAHNAATLRKLPQNSGYPATNTRAITGNTLFDYGIHNTAMCPHQDSGHEIGAMLPGAMCQDMPDCLAAAPNNKPDITHENAVSSVSAQLPPEQRLRLARAFQAIAGAQGIATGICGDADLIRQGFPAANCVDKELIERITGRKLRIRKDPGQRADCQCVESADIGAYDTCLHACRYCYANHSPVSAFSGMLEHDSESPLMRGKLEPGDKISERKVKMHSFHPKEAPSQQQLTLY